MIKLVDKETGAPIGEITAAELQILVDAFEEEGRDDQDYYVDASSPDYLETQFEGSANLVAMLRTALAGRDGMDIAWSRE
jgi:hypothetical protein